MDLSYTPKEVSSLMGLIDTHLRHKAEVIDAGKRSYEHYHPSEWGKAQPYDAIIQTPKGPTKMKDIKIGDLICGPNGDARKVIQVNPQGHREIYKIIFSDGDEVECCGEHLWEVDSSQFGFKSPKILETKELLNGYVKEQKRCLLSIRMPKPILMHNRGDENKIISPYLMGALLGDGCLRCNSVDFTSIDDEIVQTIKNGLIDGYVVHSWKNDVQHRIKKQGQSSSVNIYKQELVKYGLSGLRSEERFIPDDYLYVSAFDRYEIIKGLMDTDGTVDVRGYARFSTKSRKMANQFKWLIESIGGICIIRDKISTANGKEFYSFRCDISINNSKDLFSLSRKKERGKKRSNIVKRFIKSIELIKSKDCQCIAVDNFDGLYLTNNCIVTHNCLRMQQYKHYAWKGLLNVTPNNFDSRMLRLFDKGHNMHERWTRYFGDIGVLKGHWRCKNQACKLFDDNGKIRKLTPKQIEQMFEGNPRVYGTEEKLGIFEPEKCVCGCTEFEYEENSVVAKDLNIYGHCDLIFDCSNLKEDAFAGVRETFARQYLPKDGQTAVGDMKTISSSAWKNQLEKKGPHQYYLIQLTCYVHILGCDYGLLMYENKDNSEMKWYKVERNDEWWKVITWQSKTMQEMANATDASGKPCPKLPPPRPDTKTSYDCKSCDFKSICHTSSVWNKSNFHDLRKQFYQCLL